MKSFKKTITILCVAFASFHGYSQIHLGGQTSFVSFQGDKSFGLGVNGGYTYSENVRYGGDINYFFPKEIVSGVNQSLFLINADINYFFIGETDSSFGVYADGGLGFLFQNVKVDGGEKSSENQVYVNLGLGAEKEFNFGRLFLDWKLGLPVNQVNGQEVAVKLTSTSTFNLGVRVPLEKKTRRRGKRRRSKKRRRRRR